MLTELLFKEAWLTLRLENVRVISKELKLVKSEIQRLKSAEPLPHDKFIRSLEYKNIKDLQKQFKSIEDIVNKHIEFSYVKENFNNYIQTLIFDYKQRYLNGRIQGSGI